MKALFVLILVLSGCATHSNEQRFITAAGADILTTRVALATVHSAVEANPIGEGGAVAAKMAFYAWVKTLPEEEQAYWFEAATPALYGFSANNLAVIAGATTPVALLIGFAVWAFTREQ